MEKPNFIRRMYDWVLHWANTRYALPALFILAFAESSFFPVPPDVLLIAMAVSIPAKAFRYALVCTLGSVTGGMIGYFIGYELWYSSSGDFSSFANLFFNYIPGFTEELFFKVSKMYEDNAFLAVFTAGFTPIPYKIFTITGGVCKINFFTFIIASILSRALRFYLVSAIIFKFGAPIKSWIEKYFNLVAIAFTVLLIAGFIAVKYLM
jgi:membrane protein YqaA with SNARE-associated domain